MRLAFLSLLLVMLPSPATGTAPSDSDRFVVLSEFQVWADAAGPETYDALNKLYLERGRCHAFNLYPHYEYFVWDAKRMKHWVDEAVALGTFNVFCIGDDIRTPEGYLFTREGLNPRLAQTFFEIVEYAHQKGLMVAVEPVKMPSPRDEDHIVPWLETWIGKQVPKSRRADIVKLSIEWFDGYRYGGSPPNIAHEVEAFFEAVRKVNPDTLVYVDSIGGQWLKPQLFHRWLLSRYPGTIVSHYLNVGQVDAFRKMGARNMMVQINPCEVGPGGCHLFLYFDDTVKSLKDVVKKRVPYLSLAGVNYAYNRTDFDHFLDVVRPHLALARDVASLRRAIVPDEIAEPATKEDVKAQHLKEWEQKQQKKQK
jgi:hypothetical protein